MWRKKNMKFVPKNLILTVKHDDNSVLWECMGAAGVGNLHIIDGINES